MNVVSEFYLKNGSAIFIQRVDSELLEVQFAVERNLKYEIKDQLYFSAQKQREVEAAIERAFPVIGIVRHSELG